MDSTRQSYRALKNVVICTAYLALFATSIVFLNQALLEYWEGKTYFHQVQERLTNADRPTITVCFEVTSSGLSYPEDFWLNFDVDHQHIAGNSSIWLREGNNTVNDSKGLTRSFYLEEMSVSDIATSDGMFRHCIKLTPVQADPEKEISKEGSEQFSLEFNQAEMSANAVVYVTSEQVWSLTGVAAVARKFMSICQKLALFEFALPSLTCKLAS